MIAFQGDGSALYTVQALWTMAREGLDITTVICANRKYRTRGANNIPPVLPGWHDRLGGQPLLEPSRSLTA